MKRITLAASVALMFATGAAHAELVNRGGGLLYDTVLNVTWLQDANYAKTSGFDADGKMSWGAANSWAESLVYHDSANNLDYSGWRLATNAWGIGDTYPGGYYNITSPASELSYMYYVNLGLKGQVSQSGTFQSDFGVFGNGTIGGQTDVGPVTNLQSAFYWTGTPHAVSPANAAWVFDSTDGSQGPMDQSSEFYAWAVHPGDVAAANPVPEPETYAMLLAGLGLLGVAARRKQQSAA
jgi:hypothetical protein